MRRSLQERGLGRVAGSGDTGRRARGAARRPRAAAVACALAALVVAVAPAQGSEGGTSHVVPGASATLLDLPPTAPGWFFKAMLVDYRGDASLRLPTAAGVVANADVQASTVVVGGGYGFAQKVLGAHFGMAAFVPYARIDIAADVEQLGDRRIRSKVDGVGDVTLLPALLAWKDGNLQWNAVLPVYAPTGSYKVGRLGNPGLHHWTVDPTLGVAYANAASGLNASLHVGYAMNTDNTATDYHSGSLLHVEASVQQILPLGPGYFNAGVEAWYFDQQTCDTGGGATLGCFKGRTTGLGPVLGYIHPLGEQRLLVELKWLPELDAKRRLRGDYLWLKAVYKF